MHLPENDNRHVSRTRMKEQIVVLLGGRAAEKIVLDDICTGASNDIERATNVARDMVTRYGFSEKLGTIMYGQDSDEVFLGRDYSHGRNYSENVAAQIDDEVRAFVEEGMERAESILTEHRDLLEKCAQYLIKFEKIEGKDFYDLMEGRMDIDGNKIFLDAEDTASSAETEGVAEDTLTSDEKSVLDDNSEE